MKLLFTFIVYYSLSYTQIRLAGLTGKLDLKTAQVDVNCPLCNWTAEGPLKLDGVLSNCRPWPLTPCGLQKSWTLCLETWTWDTWANLCSLYPSATITRQHIIGHQLLYSFFKSSNIRFFIYYFFLYTLRNWRSFLMSDAYYKLD